MSTAVLCGVQSTCNEADAFLLCGNPGTGLMRSYMLFAQKTVRFALELLHAWHAFAVLYFHTHTLGRLRVPSPWLCSTQLTCSRNLVACKLIADQCGEPAKTTLQTRFNGCIEATQNAVWQGCKATSPERRTVLYLLPCYTG